MAETATEDPRYMAKAVEVSAEGSDVLVRLYTLAPVDVVPKHFYNQVTSRHFCLGAPFASRHARRAPTSGSRVGGELHDPTQGGSPHL